MISTKLKKIFYGGDYYPEQWSEDIWLEDIKLMKKANVNMVTLGVFAWALLQSNENKFNFSWLDKIMYLLAKNNIYVDLATATAAQPAWVSRKYKDVLPVDEKGIRISYGSRQSYCPNSKNYKRLSLKLVKKIAERYKNHPALVLWHINNEYACHTSICYCNNCAKEFRLWLKKRYNNSLMKVNQSWGTQFWSQYYYKWEEILPPRYTSTGKNPGQVLDYKRFISDSILNCYLGEMNILKKITPHIPVTTNFMADLQSLDYFKWAENIDIISWDSYPDPKPNYDYAIPAFGHDLMRGLKNGKNFILLEQASNQVNWRDINTNKRPRVMSLYSYQAIAHGADGIMFFQWRQSIKGAEKFHSGIITHAGNDQTRVFKEIETLGKELKVIDEILESKYQSEIGIYYDYENLWTTQYPFNPSNQINYNKQIFSYYKILFNNNIPVDIISNKSDFSKYKIIIAPLLYMIKNGLIEKLHDFISKGGIFITTFFSGIVDESDSVFKGGYPGPLRDILGIKIEEFDALTPEMSNKLKLLKFNKNLKKEYTCNLWCDVIDIEKAESLAVFSEDYYAGKPCLTKNNYGKGKAYYIATQPEDKFLNFFLKEICKQNKIYPILETPIGIEAVLRKKDGLDYLFILNHTKKDVKLDLPKKKYFDLISKKLISQKIDLKSKGTIILSTS